MIRRRRLLALGCAHCAALGGWAAGAHAQAPAAWVPPPRFARPDVATDEGGLWAMMDREETRMRRSPFLIRDSGLRDYLQGIACKLAGEHCADVRVYPVRTPFFNATMAPNGMMQVWSGLLLRVDNEAQLAAVIGHEIGHYLQRHLVDRLRDMKARAAFGMFVGMLGPVGTLGQLGILAGSFGFSRDQERDADTVGLGLLRRAGYDPREAAKVWNNLLAEITASQGEDAGKSSPMFATHPPSAERGATLARLAEDDSGGFVGEAEYARKLASLQFGLMEDELKRGQYGETLALVERRLERTPERADLHYFRGEALRLRSKDGDLDHAISALRQASAVGNEPAQVWRSLGYIHRQREQWAESKAAFARYVEQQPGAPDAAMIQTYLTEAKP